MDTSPVTIHGTRKIIFRVSGSGCKFSVAPDATTAFSVSSDASENPTFQHTSPSTRRRVFRVAGLSTFTR